MLGTIRFVYMKVVFVPPHLTLLLIKLYLTLLSTCKLRLIYIMVGEHRTWSRMAFGFSKKASIALLASLSYAWHRPGYFSGCPRELVSDLQPSYGMISLKASDADSIHNGILPGLSQGSHLAKSRASTLSTRCRTTASARAWSVRFEKG